MSEKELRKVSLPLQESCKDLAPCAQFYIRNPAPSHPVLDGAHTYLDFRRGALDVHVGTRQIRLSTVSTVLNNRVGTGID